MTHKMFRRLPVFLIGVLACFWAQVALGATTEAPVFDPPAGSYSDQVDVVLSSVTEGATIYYTTDGTDPTVESGIEYEPGIPVFLNEDTVLKAIAVKDGNTDSPVTTASYTIVATPSTGITNATPVFSPVGGTYNDKVEVTLTCATADVTIYYTTDGTEPSEANGEAYIDGSPFELVDTTTVKAVAVKEGNTNSAVATANYTIVDTTPAITVATPVFSPVTGTYNDKVDVTLTCATADATIYYTTDGTEPSAANGEMYDGNPFELVDTTTVKAIAVRSGDLDSAVATASYTIVDTTPAITVATPVFSPAAGTYNDKVEVTLTCATADATIYYTTDGTEPSEANGEVYIDGNPFQLVGTTTVKAIAVRSGDFDSAVATASYTIVATPPTGITNATPVFSPVAGTYNDSVEVSLTTSTAGATIYYTTDGADPTTDDSEYDSEFPISLDETTTVKAIAIKSGNTNSAVATANYTIVDTTPAITVATPVFSPVTGTYNDKVNVTLTCATADATIYYTTDGTEPSEANGEMYFDGDPFELVDTTTVKAIAVRSGDFDSAVATANYTIVDTTPAITVATPVFSPAAGTYNDTVDVSITCATADATIYYTTDGSVPSATNGEQYIDGLPFELVDTTTVKAIAVRHSDFDSAVATATYTVVDTPAITVAAPVFKPKPGKYFDYVEVLMTSATPGAKIYYTTDGSTPIVSPDYVFDPTVLEFLVETTTIKAVAARPGDTTSTMSVGKFTVLPLPAPKLKVKAKAAFKVTKPKLTIRGTSTFAEEVDYVIGKGKKAKKAKGVANWVIKAKLKPGLNVISIYASGLYENSKPKILKVTYTKP